MPLSDSERNRDPNRYKNTANGPMFISEYIPVNRAVAVTNTGTTQTYAPADYGATSARFAIIQVHTADENLAIEVGSTSTIANPAVGSLKVGRTYGMPYIQLPADDTKVIKVLADPSGGGTVVYSVIFVL